MTKVVTLYGVALVAACVTLCGCRQEFDYSPPKIQKTGTAATSEGKKGAAGNDGTDDKSKKTQDAVDKTVAIQDALPGPGADLIAFDEFDGVHRSGWKEPGLGEWKAAGEERDGTLVVSGDSDIFRALADPVRDGVVWYAITMHMETPVTGFAILTPSPDGKKQLIRMGFSAVEKPYTSRGFFVDADSDTKIENTIRQTFLARFNFTNHKVEAFAARDDGLTLLDKKGIVVVRPRLYGAEGKLNATALSHLRLHKQGSEKLIIDRIALARTAEAALSPQLPVRAPRPNDVAPTTESPKPVDAATAKKAG